ncbi:MAG: hypothetical protein FWC77_01640 [Defluviitaleaceae bacterium]|nr:hypothetical protein [Defluviitaleaceae bacterium]
MGQPMTRKDTIKNVLLGFIFIGAPLIGGALLGSFVEMLVFYAVFGSVNILHEITKKKLHAESVFNINEK